jgi:hypothetical protein
VNLPIRPIVFWLTGSHRVLQRRDVPHQFVGISGVTRIVVIRGEQRASIGVFLQIGVVFHARDQAADDDQRKCRIQSVCAESLPPRRK